MTTKPDMDELRQIGTEMDELIASGAWSREHFERLLARADLACGGDAEWLEFLYNHALDEWLE